MKCRSVERDSFARLWEFLRSDAHSISISIEDRWSTSVRGSDQPSEGGRPTIWKRHVRSNERSRFPPEYLSEQTRLVISPKLEAVVGEVATEDVLDRIFNDFCIGK